VNQVECNKFLAVNCSSAHKGNSFGSVTIMSSDENVCSSGDGHISKKGEVDIEYITSAL
jgi:hypothetical protein